MSTAFKEFARLEATGLWRPDAQAQRREVVVSFGEASLTISNTRDEVITHWSLAAIRRRGTGLPAIFHPEGGPDETLELGEDATEVIDALDRLRRVIDRRRPRPGRLRLIVTLLAICALLAGAVFWLPGALVSHTLNVLPASKRTEIGVMMLARITEVTGAPCRSPGGTRALSALSQRLLGEPGRLVVVPGGGSDTALLPGGTILLNRWLIEDHETAEVAAGHILAADLRAQSIDPMRGVLEHVGLIASLRLFATGSLPAEQLDGYAESVLAQGTGNIPQEALLERFQQAQVASRPYAFSVDPSGESVLRLIESDPVATGQSRAVLSDGNWVRLQQICDR